MTTVPIPRLSAAFTEPKTKRRGNIGRIWQTKWKRKQGCSRTVTLSRFIDKRLAIEQPENAHLWLWHSPRCHAQVARPIPASAASTAASSIVAVRSLRRARILV